MYSDCTSTAHNSFNCPNCSKGTYVLTVTDTTTTYINYDPNWIEIPDNDNSFMPSFGYWPHWHHEKRVKAVSKPVNQSQPLPVITRKQFMRLSTFRNLRFH